MIMEENFEPEAIILDEIDWDLVDKIQKERMLDVQFNYVVQDQAGGYWLCTQKPIVKAKITETWQIPGWDDKYYWNPSEMWDLVGFGAKSPRRAGPFRDLFSHWKETLIQVHEKQYIGMDSNGAWGYYYLEPQVLKYNFFINANGSFHPIPVLQNWHERLFIRP